MPKPCNPNAKKATSDHICNPDTGRWIKKDGKLAMQIINKKQPVRPQPVRPRKKQTIVSIVPTRRPMVLNKNIRSHASSYEGVRRSIRLSDVFNDGDGEWERNSYTRQRINRDRKLKLRGIIPDINTLPLSIQEIKANRIRNDRHRVAKAFKAGKRSQLSIRDATDFMKTVGFSKKSKVKLEKLSNSQMYIPVGTNCNALFKHTVSQYKVIQPLTKYFKRLKSIHGTKFAFHGTNMDNIHTLVPEHFNLNVIKNARAAGDGIYVTPDLNVALTYTVRADTRMNNLSAYVKYREDPVFVLVVEYINDVRTMRDLNVIGLTFNKLGLDYNPNATIVKDIPSMRVAGILRFENMDTVQKMLKNIKKYCTDRDKILPSKFASKFQ